MSSILKKNNQFNKESKFTSSLKYSLKFTSEHPSVII